MRAVFKVLEGRGGGAGPTELPWSERQEAPWEGEGGGEAQEQRRRGEEREGRLEEEMEERGEGVEIGQSPPLPSSAPSLHLLHLLHLLLPCTLHQAVL